MRLDSIEAQDDAFETMAFRARGVPRVHESTRRLQAITSEGLPPEPWYDQNEVNVWRMPQRAAQSTQIHPQTTLAWGTLYPPTEDGALLMPTIPEIVVDSPSLAPREFVQEVQRPELKRKSQDSLVSGQLPARRLQVDLQRYEQELFSDTHRLNFAQSGFGDQDQSAPAAALAVRPLGDSSSLTPQPAWLGNAFGVCMDSSPAPSIENVVWSDVIQPELPTTAPPNMRLPAFNPQRISTFSPLLPRYHKATPPPCAPIGAEVPGQSFLHWNIDLSRQVCEWLRDPGTDSTQSELTEILFGDIYRTFQEGCKPPTPMFKLKISRMTISNRAVTEQPAQAQDIQSRDAELLDWLVIEFSEIEAPTDRPRNYWLMAFPVSAVTKASCQPATSVLPNDANARSANALHTTTWTLGRTNRLPILHGHGVRGGYLQNFFSACMLGMGQIEMESLGPLFSQA